VLVTYVCEVKSLLMNAKATAMWPEITAPASGDGLAREVPIVAADLEMILEFSPSRQLIPSS
jgi:hypothetical protein